MIGETNNDPIIQTNDGEMAFLPKTFFWMFLGLLSTAIISFYTYTSGLWEKIFLNGIFEALLIAEIIVVLVFSLLFRKLSPTAVGFLYFIYAGINGVSMSCIFVLFELNSIVLLFCTAAVLFGGFAYYGYRTSKDLSNWRTLLLGTLIACIVVSVINLFLGNTMLDIMIDWVVLVAFFGITAYDMNKLKQLSMIPDIDQSKIHIYGAMQLYLDFINIFLRLLRLFGKRKN